MTTGEIDFRSFRVEPGGGVVDTVTPGWVEATAFAFHQNSPTAEHLRRVVDAIAADDRTLTGAYDTHPAPYGWGSERPVGTLATFTKALNVGNGRSLDTHLIAGVTVRPTHRRRGVMRELITADLHRAASDGKALAALHAMEATIYGRFGFGPATFSRRIEVDVSERFGLMRDPTGTVEVADPASLLDVAPGVFEKFHLQTRGSLRRPAMFPEKAAGIWAEDDPDPKPGRRTALHYADDGAVDGYVAYDFAGWEAHPLNITVADFVAADVNASLALWKYLASIDLVAKISIAGASMDDPLQWALTDFRCYNIVGEEDGLWLRVLDPVRALQARGWESDGAMVIEVTDLLGIANGIYSLIVESGRACVTRVSGDRLVPEAHMDVATLGSLYLGGVSASVLERAGRLTVVSPAVTRRLDSLFGSNSAPFCITGF